MYNGEAEPSLKALPFLQAPISQFIPWYTSQPIQVYLFQGTCVEKSSYVLFHCTQNMVHGPDILQISLDQILRSYLGAQAGA